MIYKVSESIIVTRYLENLESSVKQMGKRITLLTGRTLLREGGQKGEGGKVGGDDIPSLLSGIREPPDSIAYAERGKVASLYGVAPHTLCASCHHGAMEEKIFKLPHGGFAKGRGLFISKAMGTHRFVVYPLGDGKGKYDYLFMRFDIGGELSILSMFKMLFLPSWLLLSLVIIVAAVMYGRRHFKGTEEEGVDEPGEWALTRIEQLKSEIAAQKKQFGLERTRWEGAIREHEIMGKGVLQKTRKISEFIYDTATITYPEKMGRKIVDELIKILPSELVFLAVKGKLQGGKGPMVISAHRYRDDTLAHLFFKKLEQEFPRITKRFIDIRVVTMETDSDFSQFNSYGHNLKKALIIPLFTNRVRIGTIAFFRKEGASFKRGEIDILSLLSMHLATSLENVVLHDRVKRNYFDALKALVNALEERDTYTRGHSERVASLSEAVGKKVGLSEKRMGILSRGAAIHDIGKLMIDRKILGKKGVLTDEERKIVQGHPISGQEVIGPVPFLKEVKSCIREHHERFDGTGYPEGLGGDDLTLEGRIIAVADAFDAMVSGRPYRGPKSEKEAFKELRDNAGKQFDPLIVDLFVKAREEMLRDTLAGS